MVIFNVIKRICLTVRLISVRVRVRDDRVCMYVCLCMCVSVRLLVNKSELYSHSHRINNYALHST